MRKILRLLGCYLLGKHEDTYECFPISPKVFVTRTSCKVCGAHWIGIRFVDEGMKKRYSF